MTEGHDNSMAQHEAHKPLFQRPFPKGDERKAAEKGEEENQIRETQGKEKDEHCGSKRKTLLDMLHQQEILSQT